MCVAPETFWVRGRYWSDDAREEVGAVEAYGFLGRRTGIPKLLNIVGGFASDLAELRTMQAEVAGVAVAERFELAERFAIFAVFGKALSNAVEACAHITVPLIRPEGCAHFVDPKIGRCCACTMPAFAMLLCSNGIVNPM